jgi:hypothetical protein
LEKVEAEIASIMKLFLGGTTVTTGSLFFEVEPRHLDGLSDAPEDVDLFALDPATGHVDLSTPLVAPKPGFLTGSSALPKEKQTVHVTINSTKLFTTAELSRLDSARGGSGIHYCIPGKGQVKVLKDSMERGSGKNLVNVRTVLDQKTSLIAQYGPVLALPNSTGSEKTDIAANLDPMTGALLKVTVSGQAFDPKYIERMGNAANTMVAAQVEKQNREALENDELTRLKRQKDILQAKSDIGKLQTELEAAKVQ